MDGIPQWQPARPTALPALALLLALPAYALTPPRFSREFFILTGVVLLTLLSGAPLAGALLGAMLLVYAYVEWRAPKPDARNAWFMFGLVALHAVYWGGFFLVPVPASFQQFAFRPADAPAIFILFSGIGLTFFRLVSYYHDRLRRGFSAVALRDYLAWMLFFPQFGHGPLERCHDAAARLREARARWSWQELPLGLARVLWAILLLWGLFMVVLNLSAYSRGQEEFDFFGAPERIHPLLFLVLVHAMPFGLYYLESMWTHLILGVSTCFGFRGAEAYYYPFGAKTPCEIWHRWNITLSNWLRDYCFMPIGGARSRRLTATFATFAYCGLLHGLQWRNIWWGVWTGATIVLGTIVLDAWRGGERRRPRIRPGQALSARQRAELYVGRVLTYEWCVLTIQFIADPDYYGLRVIARLGGLLVGIGWESP